MEPLVNPPIIPHLRTGPLSNVLLPADSKKSDTLVKEKLIHPRDGYQRVHSNAELKKRNYSLVSTTESEQEMQPLTKEVSKGLRNPAMNFLIPVNRVQLRRSVSLSPLSPTSSKIVTRLFSLKHYFPLLEYNNITERCKDLDFTRMRQVKGNYKKFNQKTIAYLKNEFFDEIQKAELAHSNRYDVSIPNLKKMLEGAGKEELYQWIKKEKRPLEKLPVTDSPRFQEFKHCLQNSGILLRPLIERFIVLQAKLLKILQRENKYSNWTKELYLILSGLIAPETVYERSGVRYEKQLQPFLAQIGALLDKSKGIKTYDIIALGLGVSAEARQELIQFLNNWINPSDELLNKLKMQMKAWCWDSCARTSLKERQHEWIQHPKHPQSLSGITPYEIIRCLGNEDNGVTIIPTKITVNNTVIHNASKPTGDAALEEFFERFFTSLYKAGLSKNPVRVDFLRDDLELFMHLDANSEFCDQALSSRLAPLLLKKTLFIGNIQKSIDLDVYHGFLMHLGYSHQNAENLVAKRLHPLMLQSLDKTLSTLKERARTQCKEHCLKFIHLTLIKKTVLNDYLSSNFLEEFIDGLTMEWMIFDRTALEKKLKEGIGKALKSIQVKPKALSLEMLYPLIPLETISCLKVLGLKSKEIDTMMEQEIFPETLKCLNTALTRDALHFADFERVADAVAEALHTRLESEESSPSLLEIKAQLLHKLFPFFAKFQREEAVNERRFLRYFLSAALEKKSMSVNIVKLLECIGWNEGRIKSFMEKKLNPLLLSQFPVADPIDEGWIHRISAVVSILRLCTNSCWYHAHEYLFKLFPRLNQHPFQIKYLQGTELSIDISSARKFKVTQNKSISILNQNGIEAAKIHFSWTVEPHEDSWKGSLHITDEIEFSPYLSDSERGQIIEGILDWQEVIPEADTPFSPRYLFSPRS